MFVRSTNDHEQFHSKFARWHGFTLIELLVVLCVIGALIAFLLPATRNVRPAARRTHCKNNLKQIGVALHNYHDAWGAFPPAYTVDADGKPLHSWRTLILPYIDQQPLYNRIDLSKPWNDPVNADIFQKTHLPCYQCPSHTESMDKTTYVAVVTLNSILRPRSSCKIRDVTDGTSNTILVMEVDAAHAVLWMTPQDADESWLHSLGATKKHSHTGGAHALLADGTVKFVSQNINLPTLQGLITVDSGEEIGEY